MKSGTQGRFDELGVLDGTISVKPASFLIGDSEERPSEIREVDEARISSNFQAELSVKVYTPFEVGC